MCSPAAMAVCRAAGPAPLAELRAPGPAPLPALLPGAAARTLTPGTVEAGGAGVPAVGGDSLRAVVAGRAGEAGGLASQVVVGAGGAGPGEAGAPGAEVASGTGPSLLRVT